MGGTRRGALWTLLGSALMLAQQPGQEQDPRQQGPPRVETPDEDKKLPNGKSQKDEIAKQDHRQALNDAEELVALAQGLRDELKEAGNFVVPVASVKKTEQIEKLARRIRGRLKG